MKHSTPSHALPGNALSRREFLAQSATAAVGFSIVPRHVLGGSGYVPPSDKVNIAFIGVGAQGLRVMLHFLREPDVQGVAVCDVNKGSAGYPQWSDHEFCNSVRKLIGVDSGWEWLSPNQPIQLTHSLQVTSGMAGREPAQKIVEGYYGALKRSGQYKGCSAYNVRSRWPEPTPRPDTSRAASTPLAILFYGQMPRRSSFLLPTMVCRAR